MIEARVNFLAATCDLPYLTGASKISHCLGRLEGYKPKGEVAQEEQVVPTLSEATATNPSQRTTQGDVERALDVVVNYYRGHPDEITVHEYLIVNNLVGRIKANHCTVPES